MNKKNGFFSVVLLCAWGIILLLYSDLSAFTNSQTAVINPSVDPPVFSPNGDGIKDTTTFSFQSSHSWSIWQLNIINSTSQTLRTFNGVISNQDPNVNVVWDGKDQSNRLLSDGTYDYDILLQSDLQPPRVFALFGNVMEYPRASVNSSTPIQLSSVDDLLVTGDSLGIGTRTIYYSLQNGPWSIYAANYFTIPQEGYYGLKYFGIDRAGNTESTQSMNILVDNTPPVSVLSIGNPQFTTPDGRLFVTPSTPLTLTATDPVINGISSGTNRIMYGILPFTVQQKYSNAINLLGNDGLYSFCYQAVDNSSNKEPEKTNRIYLDQTPPVTTLSIDRSLYAESNSIYVNSDVIITLNAVDPGQNNSGVQVTKYRINGGNWITYSGSFHVYSSQSGKFTVDYYSIDNLNNTEAIKTRLIINKNDARPALACFGSAVYLAYETTRDGISEIFFKESLDGGNTWQAETNLSGAFTTSQYGTAKVNSYKPAMSCDSSGNIYLAWNYIVNKSSYIAFAKCPPGGGWSYQVLTTNTNIVCYQPCLSVNNNHIYVAYTGLDSTTKKYSVYCAVGGNSGSTWNNQTVAFTNDIYNRMASDIAVASNGDIYILDKKIGADNEKRLGLILNQAQGLIWKETNIQAQARITNTVFLTNGSAEGYWTSSIRFPSGYVITGIKTNILNKFDIVSNLSYISSNIYNIKIKYSAYRIVQIGWESGYVLECITMYGQQNCFQVYVQNLYPLFARMSFPDGVWKAAYTVNAYKKDLDPDTSSDIMESRLSLDGNNNIQIVWSDNRNGNTTIYGKSFLQQNQLWSEKQRLAGDTNNSIMPYVNSGSRGLDLVWEDNAGGNRRIYYKNSPDGGSTWSPQKHLTYGNYDSIYPEIKEISPGNNIIAFQANPRGLSEIITLVSNGRNPYEPTASQAGLAYTPVLIDPNNHANFALMSNGVIIGTAYDVSSLNNQTSFSQPFVLKFYYSDSNVAGFDKNTLKVMWFNAASNRWQPAVTNSSLIARDNVNDTLAITVNHLSEFAIFAPYDTIPPISWLGFSQPVFLTNGIFYLHNMTFVTMRALDYGNFVSGIKSMAYSTNGSVWQEYQSPLRLTNFSNRYYSVGYRSIDNAGNIEPNKFRTLGLDVTPPVSAIHVNGISSADNHVSITDQYSILSVDSMSGVNQIYYQVDGLGYTNFSASFTLDTGGWHTIKYYAIDNVGNLENTNTYSVFVDIYPPVINVSGISNGKYYNHDISAIISITDDSSFVQVNSLNGMNYPSAGIISNEGAYVLSTRAMDIFGNASSNTVSFTLDKTPPKITITGVTDGEGVNHNLNPVVMITDLNLAGTTITLNGQPYVSGTTISNEGTYALSAQALDKAGNQNSKTINFYIDKTPPDVPTGLTGYPIGTDVFLYWNPVTNSDLAGYDVYRNNVKINSNLVTGSVFTDHSLLLGAYTYTISALDKVGNESAKSLPFNVDVSRNITIECPLGGKYYCGKLKIQADIKAYNATGLYVDYGSGEYPVVWNSIYSNTHKQFKNNNAHEETVIWDTGNLNGDYIIRVRTLEGGQWIENSVFFHIDNAPPKTTLYVNGCVLTNNSILNLSLTDKAVVTMSATDPVINQVVSGVRFTKYAVYFKSPWGHGWDNGGWHKDSDWCDQEMDGFHDGFERGDCPGYFKTWNGTPIILGDSGTYQILYFSADNAIRTVGEQGFGNIERVNLFEFSIRGIQPMPGPNPHEPDPDQPKPPPAPVSPPLPLPQAVDTTPPVITVTGIVQNAFYNQDVLPVITVSDAHLSQTKTMLNNQPYMAGMPISAEGKYALYVYAVDTSGNSSSTNISFIIDKTAPLITISGVQNNEYSRTNVKINVSIVDSNLLSSNVSLDGSPYVNGTPVSAEASHNLNAQAKDKAQNVAQNSVDFTIDKTPPVIIISGVQENGSYAEAAPVIQITDLNLDNSKTIIQLNGNDYLPGTAISSNNNYDLFVHAQDLAANVTEKHIHFSIYRQSSTNTLLFYAGYNRNGDADFAKGSSNAIAGGLITSGDLGRLPGEALSDLGRGADYNSDGNINPTNGTVMMWVKPSWIAANDQGKYLFCLKQDNNNSPDNYNMNLVVFASKGTALQIKDRAGNYHEFDIDNGPETNRWYSDKAWTHIAFSWNSKTGIVKMYLNGTLKKAFTNSSWVPNTMADMWVGNRHDDDSRKSECRIDEFRIFGRELSANEIKDRSGMVEISQIIPENPGTQFWYLEKGNKYYCDRVYIITNLPVELRGGLFIKTANFDKQFSKTSQYLSWKADEDQTVYIAFDSRVNPKPQWLSAFQPCMNGSVQKIVGVTDVEIPTLKLYRQDFTLNTIIQLDGNGGQGDLTSNYFVIIMKKGQ